MGKNKRKEKNIKNLIDFNNPKTWDKETIEIAKEIDRKVKFKDRQEKRDVRRAFKKKGRAKVRSILQIAKNDYSLIFKDEY